MYKLFLELKENIKKEIIDDIKQLDLCKHNNNGLIRKKCMRFKCNQPIMTREYEHYTPQRPLFCVVCWESVYYLRDNYVQFANIDIITAEKRSIEMHIK